MLEVNQSTRFKNMLVITVFMVIALFILYFSSSPSIFGIKINPLTFFKSSKENVVIKEEVLSEQTPSIFADISKPIYGYPKKIIINSIGVSADVVSLGVDKDGYLETPKNWNEVGWYSKGAKPSEKGNFLINAHYDDSSGKPAIFYRLKNLNVGDKVSVLDSYGRTFDYKVSNIYYVDIADPERTKVFEPFKDDASVMTMITCGGVWSEKDGTYNERLVVNAELIQE